MILHRKAAGRHARLIILLFVIAGAVSCDNNRIAFPVCTCAVRGSTWTIDQKPGTKIPLPTGEDNYFIHRGNTLLTSQVTDLIYSANDNAWIPGADLAMVALLDADGNIPVIDDPDVTTGKYGAISISSIGVTEGSLAAQKCREAYGKPADADDLIIIIARNLINNDGSATNESGYTENYDNIDKMNLCNFPRNITRENTKGRYIVLDDPALYTTSAGHGMPYVILAHELGHVLMLGHGDGLDNDNSGQLPPGNGPRLFDEYCDFPEYKKYDLAGNQRSLMSPVVGYNVNITSLQKELARGVASLMPGATGKP